jgi:transposase
LLYVGWHWFLFYLTFPRKIVFQGWRKIAVTQEEKKMKIPKQEYTAEFKELAVKRVKSGQTAGAVAKDLGLIEQTLRNWVKAADAGKLNGAGGKVVTPEQMELSRLRVENVRLKREVDILKKATAYFAREIL